MCERCAMLEEAEVTKNEKRREQLESWTQEELVEAVLALEAEVRGWKVPQRAVVCCRQGPHRVQFSIGFESGELYQLVLAEAFHRRAHTEAGNETMDRALAIHEYIHHYLCEGTHEWTRALGHSLSGEVCRF